MATRRAKLNLALGDDEHGFGVQVKCGSSGGWGMHHDSFSWNDILTDRRMYGLDTYSSGSRTTVRGDYSQALRRRSIYNTNQPNLDIFGVLLECDGNTGKATLSLTRTGVHGRGNNQNRVSPAPFVTAVVDLDLGAPLYAAVSCNEAAWINIFPYMEPPTSKVL